MSEKMLPGLVSRIERDWSRIANDVVSVENFGDVTYGFTSEIGALRIYAKYNTNGEFPVKNVFVGYSPNMKSWYFKLESKHGWMSGDATGKEEV